MASKGDNSGASAATFLANNEENGDFNQYWCVGLEIVAMLCAALQRAPLSKCRLLVGVIVRLCVVMQVFVPHDPTYRSGFGGAAWQDGLPVDAVPLLLPARRSAQFVLCVRCK
jgi:hypothetical protein